MAKNNFNEINAKMYDLHRELKEYKRIKRISNKEIQSKILELLNKELTEQSISMYFNNGVSKIETHFMYAKALGFNVDIKLVRNGN